MPAYAFDFEMAQKSNHSFFSYFFLEILITCLLAEVAHFFQLEKIEMAQIWNHFCLEFNLSTNGSNFEPSQNQMYMLARDIVSIDDFLSYLTIAPYLLFAMLDIACTPMFPNKNH